jgi:hypothetical protein
MIGCGVFLECSDAEGRVRIHSKNGKTGQSNFDFSQGVPRVFLSCQSLVVKLFSS